MRASVREDTTTRTITLEVSGVPNVDATQRWHAKPRVFAPDHVTIRLVDGEVREVKASGPFVLKNGAISDKLREDLTWRPDKSWGSGSVLSDAPEWVRTLVREAPAGVLSWTTPYEVPA